MASVNPSIEKLQKKLDKDPNSLVFVQLVEEHRKEGNYEAAVHICKEGLRRHPNYWSARVALGRIHHQMGNPESAREELEKVIQAVPDNLLANKLLGDIYSSSGRPHDALKRYRIVQMLTPTDQEVAENIRRIEYRFAQEQEAATPSIEEAQPATVQIAVPFMVEKSQPEEFRMVEETQTVQELLPDAKYEEPQAVADTLELVQPQTLAEDIPEMPPLIPPSDTAAEDIAFELNPDLKDEVRQTQSDTELLPDNFEKIEPDAAHDESMDWSALDEDMGEDKGIDIAEMAAMFLQPEATIEDSQQTKGEVGIEGTFSTVEMEQTPAPLERPSFSTVQMESTAAKVETEIFPDVEGAEEITTETLAELYVQQGLTDKATKVYEKLLLNDPNNVRIAEKLRELNTRDRIDSSGTVPPEITDLAPVEFEEISVDRVVQDTAVNSAAEERKRKIATLENWLATIRRQRDR